METSHSQEFVSCPICNEKVRNCELKNHCDFEFDRMIKKQILNASNESSEAGETSQSHIKKSSTTNEVAINKENETSSTSENLISSVSGTNIFSIYQKVRHNRQARVRACSRKRPATNSTVCPICNERPIDNINLHVEKCLKNSVQGSASDDENIDIEGETMPEYQWAGRKRIRAPHLLPGRYSSMAPTLRNPTSSDEDEDLNVDGDDTVIYGPSQYQDSDIIAPLFLYSNEFGSASTESNSSGGLEDEDPKEEGNNAYREHSTKKQKQESAETIIKSLKSRIRELDTQTKNKIKCLICLDDFKDPAVSVCCWHVHCELCWLRTLGARKLCPQCNLITTPTDLRRIYM